MFATMQAALERQRFGLSAQSEGLTGSFRDFLAASASRAAVPGRGSGGGGGVEGPDGSIRFGTLQV